MNQDKLIAAIKALPRERTMLLPALQIVQGHLGFLPRWAMEEVGQWLHVPKSEVYGAATSYAGLRHHPPPAHQVKVCCGAGCRMNGSDRLVRKAEDALGVSGCEENPGGSIELGKVDCAFVCALAPVVQVDGIAYGRMTEDELDEKIKAIQRADAQAG
ncbi:MAG: NAD(P)H-dependent oxidoreductase subunit E [Chloroflexi bacterium]|nr:NAD(P)H-dependent oxidoreductase subunit E [Chloroflexota bacterium]